MNTIPVSFYLFVWHQEIPLALTEKVADVLLSRQAVP